MAPRRRALAAAALPLFLSAGAVSATRRPLWTLPSSESSSELLQGLRWLVVPRTGSTFACAPGDDPAVCAALGDLYAATNGPGWAHTEGWAEAAAGVPTAVCRFHGVGCDAAGAVTHLYLLENGLSGSLPASLGDLAALTDLWLGNNALVSSIPTSIGRLTNLEALSLSYNRLSGAVPEAIGALAKLQALFLEQNKLEGSAPPSIAGLGALQLANVADSGLCGQWPILIRTYEVSLPPCFTCGAGDSPAICAALGDLYAATNGHKWLRQDGWADAAAGTPTRFRALCTFYGVGCDKGGAVTSLILQQNGLSGSLPPSLGALTRLTDLWLNINSIAGTVPPSIASLTSLVVLSFADNKFTGAVPEAIGSLAKLQYLFLDNTELAGSVPASAASLSELQLVALEHSGLCGEWPAARQPFDGPLAPCPAASIALSSSSDDSWSSSESWPSSSYVPLSYNRVPPSAKDVWQFVDPPAAVAFMCTHGDDPVVCAALGDLYAVTNGPEWSFDGGWFEAANGEAVPLCSLYGVGCDADGAVTSLYLSRNGLAGVFPDSLGSLTALRMLDLSSNELVGAVPKALGGLHELQFLNIAGNHFDGPAPLGLRSHALQRLKMDWEQFA